MKKIIAAIVSIALLHTSSAIAQYKSEGGFYERGTVLENQSMKSDILDEDVHYAIYLPPGYAASDRSYPVVYLLHGYSDDQTAWIQFGEVHRTADRAIADRVIPPMIIVMPDAKVTFYINDAEGKYRYEDMVFEEFIPHIDTEYRTRAKKEFRGVAGLSMGGFGTLVWSLRHPDTFAACAAYSAAVWTEEEILNMPAAQLERRFGKLFGATADNPVTPHWEDYSVMPLMRSLPVEEIEKVRYYIDCGDDDFLYKGNASLHILMRERGIDHEYRVRDGGHTWEYWRNHIIHGLEFIGKSFSR